MSHIKQNSNDYAVIIMGGGIEKDGSLPSHLQPRVEKVIESYNSASLVICSSSFSLNVPPKLTKDGYVISEASVIARELKKSCSNFEILCEQFSHDTVGSVFFCFDLFIKPRNIKKIIIITSDFHAKRVTTISDYINSYMYKGFFEIIVEEVGFCQNFEYRIKHEERAVELFRKEYEFINNRSEFLIHLTKNHLNYNCSYSGRKNKNLEFY